ncbi:MAG: 4-hydroxy-tetrahydrodipicolinate synthase [Clostridia bacterium]|nr:4-hydroxy-tetrahydrodipicolinate synthase [Clostridia bacterium]
MQKTIFKGVGTALYTPVTGGKIDYGVFEKRVEFQIENGIDALVFLGTTGESATINDDERSEIIRFSVNLVNKRVPVIIGCGSNSTEKAVNFVKEARSAGADAALCVTPYYNKCTQTGLIRHYEEIDKCGFPFIVYNVPSRTGFNAFPETVKEIANFENCVGLKEANADEGHIQKVFDALTGKSDIYCGNDDLNGLFYSLGASGTISVASNIIPLKIKHIFSDFKMFSEMENTENFRTFIESLHCEVNPIPLKAMVGILNMGGDELRLPLTKSDEKHCEYYRKVLADLFSENGGKSC